MTSWSTTIGVDIGGTKVAAGLVDDSGCILLQTRVPMIANGDAQTGLRAVESAVQQVLAASRELQETPVAIGVCCPGPLDPHSGTVLNPPNLPCWRNFPLASILQFSFSLPVRIGNDANAAALAEAIWGAGQGYRSVFYTTLGTGVGAGIVLDGRIYHGRTGSAAEGGHVTIDFNGPQCQCGKRGCIEAYCSGGAIAQRARMHLDQPRRTKALMLELAGGNLDHVRAEIVAEAFRQGDAIARQVLEETADLLAVWLGTIIDLLEPDVLIFGGGLSELISCFFDYIRDQLPRYSINQRATEIPMVRARYGADAGIAGGAALFRDAQADAAGKEEKITQEPT